MLKSESPFCASTQTQLGSDALLHITLTLPYAQPPRPTAPCSIMIHACPATAVVKRKKCKREYFCTQADAAAVSSAAVVVTPPAGSFVVLAAPFFEAPTSTLLVVEVV